MFPLAVTLLNLLTWKRPRPKMESAPGRVSVLIPARNEELRLGALLASIVGSPAVMEVLVYDDQSSDGTADLVRHWATKDTRVRLLSGGPLPRGWVGKPHACQRLFEAARGEHLLFVDADVVLESGAIAALSDVLDRGSRVVTAVPRQEAVGFAERLMIPLLVMTYTSWLPLRLVDLTHNTWFVAANGQLLALRRADCALLGGFEEVRSEIVDDVAYCRWAKRRRLRVSFVDGSRLGSCRMYRSAHELWRGFSKNIFDGLGSSRLLLVLVLGLHLALWVMPYVAVGWGLAVDADWLRPGLVGVACCVALRGILVARFGQPLSGVLWHPVAVLGLCALALNSYVWHERGRIEWAGRAYGPRRARA